MKTHDLRVSLEPAPWDNPTEPFFWWVAETYQKDCGQYATVNTGCCGWSKTPGDAFADGWEAWQKWNN